MSRPNPSGAALAGAAAVFAAGATGLLTWETYALATGRKPITDRVRRQAREHPYTAGILACGACLLLGHLYWR
jgi:hypothetical protein